MKQLDKLITKYSQVKSQATELDGILKDIRSDIADILHRDKVNEKIGEDADGILWKCIYQSTTRKQINYMALSEIVSDKSKYDEIVTQKTSVSLVIRKAPQNKKTKTKVAPKTLNITDIPIGSLS